VLADLHERDVEVVTGIWMKGDGPALYTIGALRFLARTTLGGGSTRPSSGTDEISKHR